MKKKLALALAAVMSVSAFSGFSASAASASVTTMTKSYAKHEVTVMGGTSNSNIKSDGTIPLDSARTVYQGGIPYLQLNFTDTLTTDLSFNLSLSNAEFNLYNADGKGVNYNLDGTLATSSNVSMGSFSYVSGTKTNGLVSDSDVVLNYTPASAATSSNPGEIGFTFTPWKTEKGKATVTVNSGTTSTTSLGAGSRVSGSGSLNMTYGTTGSTGTVSYSEKLDTSLTATVSGNTATYLANGSSVTVNSESYTPTADPVILALTKTGIGVTASVASLPSGQSATSYADAYALAKTAAEDAAKTAFGDSTSIGTTGTRGTTDYAVAYWAGYDKYLTDNSITAGTETAAQATAAGTAGTDAADAAKAQAVAAVTVADIEAKIVDGTYYANAYYNGSQVYYVNTATVSTTTTSGAGTVYNGQYIRIPLVMRFTSTNTISITVSDSSISAFNGTYVLSSAGSGTTLTAKSVETGKNNIELDRITLRENAAGAFKANGTATLELNSNLEFKSSAESSSSSYVNGVTVTANYMYTSTSSSSTTNNLNVEKLYVSEKAARTAAGLTTSTSTDWINSDWSSVAYTYAYLNEDATAIVIQFGSALTTLSAPSYASIYFDGLVVRGEGGDAPSAGTVATLTTTNDEAGVTVQTVDVAKFSGYNLNYSAADAVSIYAGDLKSTSTTPNGLLVAKVTVEEGIANKSWWVDTETAFTLTDADGNKLTDVKFAEVKVDYTDVTDTGKVESAGYLKNITGQYNDSDYWYYSNDGSTFYLNEAASVADSKAKAVLTIYLSADAGFEGDVYLTIGGDSVPSSRANIENNGTVKVATVKSKITVDTKVTEVQVGYQTYSVADVTITEAEPGLLTKDEEIVLGIGEFNASRSQSDIYFNPVTDDQISTTGDIKVTAKKSSTTSYLALNVDKRSTSASTISLSNLAVKINRSNPVGTYELNVYGYAVIKNDNDILNSDSKTTTTGYKRYGFDNPAYTVSDYVKVVSETGFDVLTQEVTIYQNSTAVLVDGVTLELDAPTKNVDGRLYVPLRFLSLVFGATNEQIIWDNETRNVQITIGGTTVTWTQDSEYYVKGGVRMAMTEDGVVSKAFISTDDDESNGRTYIPFRYFGYAFNIPVNYDEATGAATYNKKVDTTLTTSSASTAE